MNMMIRRATQSDQEVLTQLLADLFTIETDYVIDHAKQKSGLMLLLADTGKNIIFVADCGQDIQGMVTAQLVVSTAAGGYAVLLEDMIVRENYRGHDIGSALFAAVKNWADEKGAKRIQLLTDQRNQPALIFYEKLGFSESSMCGLYLQLGR